jgi:hypothetical protein
VIATIKAALGRLAGSLLGLAIIGAFVLLPVSVVLWIGVALGVPWAITAQVRVVLALAAARDLATTLLPAWIWFVVITLLWLAFLDVHVRWLVRDELAKQSNRPAEKP